MFLINLPGVAHHLKISPRSISHGVCVVKANRKEVGLPQMHSVAFEDSKKGISRIVDTNSTSYKGKWKLVDTIYINGKSITVMNSKHLLTWSEAYQMCKGRNEHLPFFPDEDALHEMLAVIKRAVWVAPMEAMFIGLFRQVKILHEIGLKRTQIELQKFIKTRMHSDVVISCFTHGSPLMFTHAVARVLTDAALTTQASSGSRVGQGGVQYRNTQSPNLGHSGRSRVGAGSRPVYK